MQQRQSLLRLIGFDYFGIDAGVLSNPDSQLMKVLGIGRRHDQNVAANRLDAGLARRWSDTPASAIPTETARFQAEEPGPTVQRDHSDVASARARVIDRLFKLATTLSKSGVPE